MHSGVAFRSSGRWAPTRAAVLVLGTGTAVAGGGSSHSAAKTPRGLDGTQAGVAGSAAAEEPWAPRVLTPRPGPLSVREDRGVAARDDHPASADIYPDAVGPVIETIGSVSAGDVLVDNLKNSANNQGTGTTIVDLHADGHVSVLAEFPQRASGCPTGLA